MKNPLEALFSQLKLRDNGNKPTKLGYILIIALAGILILIVGNMFQTPTENENPSPLTQNVEEEPNEQEVLSTKDENNSNIVADLVESYETDLTELLEVMEGVSEVEVMVNLDSTNQKVYEKNLIVGTQSTEETDQNGGQRVVEDVTEEQQVVIIRQGDKEMPLVVQTKKPEVRGVLVVAKGVENLQVKQWVTEAVSRVLDVPSHRISVQQKNKGK